MADAGIGEAALLAAAAESASAAAAAGGTAAAVLPEVVGAGTALAGTAAGTAAAAAPEVIAAAAPEIALATAAPTAAEAAATVAPVAAEAAVPTATEAATTSLLPTAAETVPTAAEVPSSISLLPTESEPVSGGLLGNAAEYPLPGSAADYGSAAPDAFAMPDAVGPQGYVDTGQWDQAARGLGEKLGHWWETASTGEKLKTAGTALSAVQGGVKAMTPSTPTKGPTRTMQPGTTGKPMGGEQALAAVVEGLLKRRDAYLQAQQGTPIAYRPRSLLG